MKICEEIFEHLRKGTQPLFLYGLHTLHEKEPALVMNELKVAWKRYREEQQELNDKLERETA